MSRDLVGQHAHYQSLEEVKSIASLVLHLHCKKRTDLHEVPGGAYGLAGKGFQFPIRLPSP
jgi:hypothetical protein